MKTISIIIPTYNHAKRIMHCIESVLAQTRKANQVIVVDDGSSDNTKEVLKDVGRITFISQKNEGAPSARNHGFRDSKGDYLLFCDADVVMRPHMLERLEKTLEEHPEASYAYAKFKWGWKKFPCRVFDADALRKRNFIHSSAALMRREHFPGWDESVKKFQDWDLWLTMLEQGHGGVFVDEELYTVVQDHGRLNISSWLPKFMYKVPWKLIGWKPKQVQTYENAREIIAAKHHL